MISKVSKTSWFTRFAQFASHITGRPVFFVAARGRPPIGAFESEPADSKTRPRPAV